MGALLASYMSQFGNSLAQAAGQQQPSARRGRNAPRNRTSAPPPVQMAQAETFPMGEGPATPPLQVSPPTFRNPESFRGMNPQDPSRGMRDDVRPPRTFDAPQTPPLEAGSTPSFEAPPAEGGITAPPASRGGNRLQPSEVTNFDQLMDSADPAEIEAGIAIVEQQAGGEEGMREQYAKVTGSPPDDRLTKKDIGMLLMEFGLRTLAYNSSSDDSFGAMGRAGAETLGMAREMKQVKRDAPAAEQMRQAELSAMKARGSEIVTADDGAMTIVNMGDGTSKPILDAEGNPVQGESGRRDYERQQAKDMYMAVECAGMEGEEAAACERRALGFSLGAREIAFPELAASDIVTRTQAFLTRDEDMRFTVPSSGQQMRWRDMTPDQQDEVLRAYVEQNQRLTDQAVERTARPPAPQGWGNFSQFGITEENARNIPTGTQRPIRGADGGIIGYVANRNGRLIRVNTDGSDYQDE